VVSAASVLPYSGLLGTFQETVDCTGAMSGLGTLCDGCDVCKGNGSTCNADCDNAVASGRKYDDCNFCGGSTFYYPNQRDGLPWNPTLTIDDVSPSIAMSDFQATYCSGMFQQPSDIFVYFQSRTLCSNSHCRLSSRSRQRCHSGFVVFEFL